VTAPRVNTGDAGARRALVLHDRPLVVDLIRLTLKHGLFVPCLASADSGTCQSSGHRRPTGSRSAESDRVTAPTVRTEPAEDRIRVLLAAGEQYECRVVELAAPRLHETQESVECNLERRYRNAELLGRVLDYPGVL
jgi:hypothetical protein